jgi:hypothetical protein
MWQRVLSLFLVRPGKQLIATRRARGDTRSLHGHCEGRQNILTRLSAFILMAIEVQIMWNGLSSGMPALFAPVVAR